MNLLKMLLISAIVFLFLNGCETNSEENSPEENKSDDNNSCGFNDGLHSATVDYYNSETGHNAAYDLEVEVEDCQVTQINFPKGGWLDSDHITPEQIDNNGNATMGDDRGRSFEVHIDN